MLRNLITRTGIILVAMLVLTPAAQAGARAATTPDNWAVRPAPNPSVVHVTSVQWLPDDRPVHPHPTTLATAPAVVVRTTPGGGFAWGDAAIGAAAMLGLTLVAGAATAGVRSRRRELAA
jgi:hypothetical protein